MPQATPRLSTTSPSDWIYTAEGGANLVVSYGGPPGPFSHRVLRLRKTQHDGSRSTDEAGEADLDFSNRIVARLLARDNVVDMTTVDLDEAWLTRLARAVDESGRRPIERKSADRIDVGAKRAIVAEDLIRGRDVLSFEIKPKWGFLPSTTHLSARTLPLKSTYCRFCMHRVSKSSTTPASTLADADADADAAMVERHDAGYCPLDLFSLDPARVERAVERLLTAWIDSNGTTNNLRLFASGTRVEPNDPTSISHALDLVSLYSAPISESRRAAATASDYAVAKDSSTLRDRLVDLVPRFLTRHLVSSDLLSTLSRLESTLDAIDIEGIAQTIFERHRVDLYEDDDDDSRRDGRERGGGAKEVDRGDRVRTELEEMLRSKEKDETSWHDVVGPQPTVDEWAAFLETYLARHASHSPSAPRQDGIETESTTEKDGGGGGGGGGEGSRGTGLARDEVRYLVMAYLLSATFKDCSIMLRFTRPSHSTSSSSSSSSASSTARRDSPGTDSPLTPLAVVSVPERVQVEIKAIDLDPKPIHRLSKYARLDREVVEAFGAWLDRIGRRGDGGGDEEEEEEGGTRRERVRKCCEG
ncbi:hypothetical protein JCM10212_004790 [Sporobolomyces blumeae]